MTVDTLRLSAEDANELVTDGEVSSDELYRAYLDAIGERDPELHAFLYVCENDPGEGIPIAVKDVIGTRGFPTTAGSKILESYIPVYDSTVITNCRARGLCVIGKTNTDECVVVTSTDSAGL